MGHDLPFLLGAHSVTLNVQGEGLWPGVEDSGRGLLVPLVSVPSVQRSLSKGVPAWDLGGNLPFQA